jgi:hypothetical protein
MDPIITGALIGGGAQILGSGIQSWFGEDAADKDREARKAAAKQLRAQGDITDAEYNNLIGQIDAYYQQRGSLGSLADANEYRKAIYGLQKQELENKGKEYTANDFKFKGSKEDYINPYYSRIIGDTANQIQHSAAGAGLGRGTGAAMNIAKGVSEKSDELYSTAMQDYQNDRDFEYKKFADAIRNNQQRLQNLQSNTQYKINQIGNLANDYYNTQDARMSDQLKAQQDRLNAQASYANAIAGLY